MISIRVSNRIKIANFRVKAGEVIEVDKDLFKVLEEKGFIDEVLKKETVNISDFSVDEGEELLASCNDLEQLKTWLEEESHNKKRKTLLEPLTEKIEELEDKE